VSWGGFKTSVSREAVPAFFKIRLWDQGELLRQLLDNYDRLPETLKADLLLKRIWALAPEEETE
jgi:restriction system protein